MHPTTIKITEALAANACINGARLGRPVEAHRAGTYLMRWLEARHPLVSGQRHNVHAYSREAPHVVAVRHRYKPPTYPAHSEFTTNSPTTFGTLPNTRKKPLLATRLDAELDGLGREQ